MKTKNFSISITIFLVIISVCFLQAKTDSKDKDPKWKVWKTIKIGGKSDSVLNKQIESDLSFKGWGYNYLPEYTTDSSERSIDLVVVSVADLGYKEDYEVIYNDLVRAAESQGLKLCPAEVGPQLRLQYRNQPKDEWLYVMMDPIMEPPLNSCVQGYAHIFNVAHQREGLALLGREFRMNDLNILYFFEPTDLLVFQLEKKTE
jgi:hypothetical protein